MSEKEEGVTLEEAYERGGFWKFKTEWAAQGVYYLLTPKDNESRDGKLQAGYKEKQHPLCSSVVVINAVNGEVRLVEFTETCPLTTNPSWKRCNVKLALILDEEDTDG